MINEDEIARREEEANRIMQELYENRVRPNPDSYGIFAYGDASPGIGGGHGAFLWFNTLEEIYDYIKNILPYCPPGPSGNDALSVEQQVAETIDRFKDQGRFKFITELNKHLRRYSQIEWFGQLSELYEGDCYFCCNVRNGFWERMSRHRKNNSISMIDAKNSEEFLDYLEEYGS